MAESLPSNDPGTQKRRSTRIVQAVPITVTGVDALGQAFKERTTTVMVNCHGCKYQSKHYVPKNSMVTLEIPRPEAGAPLRTATGRVIWVQRPRAVRELFQIGVEFEIAGNVWGIAFPPEDWFPCPGEEAAAPPAPGAPAVAPTVAHAHAVEPVAAPPAPAAPEPSADTSAQMFAPEPAAPASGSAAAPAAPVAPPAAPAHETKIHLVPELTPSPEMQLAAARQMARMAAEVKDTLGRSLRREAQTAINDEMTVVRQQLDAQLHEAVERAIKVSMERVSESSVRKVVQQAAERTAAIVEEARKAGEASVEQLDAKIRQAVEQAVTHAAESAAQQAAAQAATQNLRQTVEEAVERVLTEREATSPSLQILSNPEAAQQQVDQWKRNLEEAAQNVRNESIAQAQADGTSARLQWNQEIDSALANASQRLGERVNEVLQERLAGAAEDVSARAAGLRASLDEAAAGAQFTIDQMRQRVDEIISARVGEMERRADQVIAERTQHLEPVLQNAAQKMIEHFSGELDQKLAPRIADAQKALSEVADAREQAAQLSGGIREQVRQASEQALAESIERLRQETGKYPAAFEETCRAALAKVEEELEQKTADAQHTTYEALLKAADWYQKKAQTTMQSAMEKAVEQSTSSLRDRAAEISSLVASELDHYRRTYVDHSHAQIEEAAKEVVERERAKFGETADTAAAAFTDRVQQGAAESLRRFEEASRQALEKARSDMEYDREGSLGEFQQRVDQRTTQAIEQAHGRLQSQLASMMGTWEARRQVDQAEWQEQLKRSSNESIEEYKTRLENTTNAWLLASATTLGQNSQAVLDTLAKSAEKLLRETCAEVLVSMGDVLKERMMGISTGFAGEEDEQRKK
ncbi:MAG: hypothetical protein ABSE45_11005 [Candidatus Acidiferrales bacterium]